MLQYSHIEADVYLSHIGRLTFFENKLADVDYIFLDISNELTDHPIIPIVCYFTGSHLWFTISKASDILPWRLNKFQWKYSVPGRKLQCDMSEILAMTVFKILLRA